MPVTLTTDYLKDFVSESDYAAIAPEVNAAVATLNARNGAGSDFLG